ncbi:ABC transporter B family member 25 [Hordeum vulgare]|nr:ABC transporter B family member 25 [Hordeum vulgare]
MWSSGRGSGSRSNGGSDLERERRVCSDAARKRGARRWTNCGISLPASFRRSETKEYNRRCASFSSSYVGSSSSSGAGLLPVKREWSEDEHEPEERAVKEEPEELASLGRRGVVGTEDYVADIDPVAAAITERSVREEADRRRHVEELEDLEWRQVVAANLAAKEKHEEWRRIHEEQSTKYIDLCSSDEED